MNKKIIMVLVLVLVLGGIVVWEQVYTDSSINTMLENIEVLETGLNEENLESSKSMAEKIVKDWDKRESIICLFVDFRDIEQIGRQADLVLSHLNNQDFELARVECNTLQRVVETFRDMVRVDITNIL